jgi:caffeoyl-CoA O-methyltransferase
MSTSPEDKGFGQGDPKLAAWAEGVFHPEDDVLREIRERSVREGLPAIAVGRFDGLHLEVIARAIGARTAVEIGTLGGYSGVCLLRGLAPDGVLYTLEYSQKHADVAKESFAKAGFAKRARIHVGAALDNLRIIESQGPFDLCFIDADKVNYPGYLEWAARNLRLGGVVLGDNAFAWGRVVEQEQGDENITGLREFNQKLGSDPRWRATMIPTAEGLAMGVKVRG